MRRVRIVILAAALLILSAGAVCLLPARPLAYEAVREKFSSPNAELLDRQGRLLQTMRLSSSEKRADWAALEAIPRSLTLSVQALEDRRFTSHYGVDLRALGAALLSSIGGRRRGASTISMQLVSLLSGRKSSQSRSLLEKVRQIAAALLLEQSWSKEQILEAYLNLVSFRGEHIGVSAASARLFGKRPEGLLPSESAILAALIRRPQASSAEAASRACYALKFIDPAADCAGLSELSVTSLNTVHSLPPETALAPQLAHHLLAKSGAESVVRTTLDYETQSYAVDLLKRRLAPLASRNVRDAALLALDNETGDVLAYVGNTGDLASRRFVDGIRAKRQAGSSLKPFLYALAFDKKIVTAASELDDNPAEFPVFGGLYRPLNYDRQFHGQVSLRTALASSMNVVSVKLLDLVGVEAFLDKLKDLGFSPLRDADYYGVSLALGSAGVSLWDLAGAYRSLARGGIAGGLRVLPEQDLPGKRVFSSGASFIVSDILSDRSSRALAFGLENPLSTPYWSAVKTGTSRDMVDNWCLGFSERYTVGVWVGNFSGEPMWNVSGVTGAATVWNEMLEFLEHRIDAPKSGPVPPAGLRKRNISPGHDEYFLPGTEPSSGAEDTGASHTAEPRIVYPVSESVFALDPDIPPAHQRIPIRIESATAEIGLLVDGVTVQTSEEPYLWEPSAGRHSFALSGSPGRAQSPIEILVKGYFK